MNGTAVGHGLRLRAIAAVTAAAMTLSACAGPAGMSADGRPLTPAEIQMRAEANEFNETVAGGAATGAVVGAVLGALLAAAAGGNQRGGGNIAAGAAIGAVAGGVLGGADGYLVAKQREAASQRVRVADAMARDIQADNQKLAGLVRSSEQVLADSRARLDRLKADSQSNVAAREQLRREQVELQANATALRSSLDGLKKRQANYADAARQSGDRSSALDQQIGQLNQQIAALEGNLQGMNSALQVSRS